MRRGKYEAPRRRGNPIMVFFWIIFAVFLILGIMVLLKFCGNTGDPQNPTAAVQTDPRETTAATAPATEATTAPTTSPVTEPTTEPVTEPATEPTTAPTEPPQPADDTLGAAIVATAKAALGKPYEKGGTGPDSFDTSGLIRYCFRQHSISVPRSTASQFEGGAAVEKEDLMPGDVVFFYLENPGKAEYVGIYTGENTFIAVSTSENAVLERKLNTTYYKEHYLGARRYAVEETANP